MKKSAIKDLVYGGIEEILNNRDYYYHSAVGADYSHFTEDGKTAVTEFLNVMAFKIKQAEDKELDHRAKQMVLNALKGDSNKSG